MTNTDDQLRKLTRSLFADRDEPQPEAVPETPTGGNTVAAEGSNPTPGPSADAAAREWVRDLLGHPGQEWV